MHVTVAFLDESEAAVQRRSNVVFHNHFISLWKVVLTDITMPKEHKKRGRREEKKRKHEDEPDGKASKRRKSQDAEEDVEIIVDNEGPGHFEDNAADLRLGQIPFYGMLDDEEQEYFKRADSMLELNQFANQEERELFLANVYKEANGKELKIANSQSCSRLLERLIVMSKPVQMKALFQRFSGQYV
jgi:nucleolar protein 9